jgi:hypothetical protein
MGSGKSRAIVEEVVQSGLDYPGIPMAVYRKTMPSLRDSTMREYRSLVPEGIGAWRERDDLYYFFNKSTIAFRGLDDPNKAKSTNYGLIVMEEADEFSYEDFVFLNARIRAPGPWPLRIILLLNPVDEDHWIYKQFVLNKESWESAGRAAGSSKGLEVIHFRTQDNIKNLPPGYIEQISAGMTEDEIDRYVNGNWGTIVRGERVYGKLMNPSLHIRQPKVDSSYTLCRGWDFGFNHPACSFRVVDPFGRKNINFELMGNKEDLETFARRVVEVTRQRYGGLTTFDYCDPRGHDKKDTGDSSVSILNGLGIWPTGERGIRDYVEPGIQVVRKELSTLIEGIPELTISPEAPILRTAYFNRYVRGEDGRPVKDGYYDHLCDADRYIAYHHKSNAMVRDLILAHRTRRQTPRNRYTGY